MALDRYCSPLTWAVLRFLRKTRILPHISYTVNARIMGTTVRVPIVRGTGENMLYVGEPWAHAIYPLLLRAFPGTFVDVGVNLGQTLTRVRILEADRAYIGFEPNPLCVHYARELARLNGFAAVPIVEAGLADVDGAAQLSMNDDNAADEGATVVPDFRPGRPVRHRMEVKLVRFATVERDMTIGRLGMVKIDVEGSEREVLLSIGDRLRNDRAAVLLEILPTGVPALPDRLQRQQDIEAFFQRIDYRLLRIHNKPGSMKLERMEGPIGIHNDQDLANFIVLPAERCDELMPVLTAALQQ